MDNNSCLDVSALTTIAGKNLMKKMGLTVNNLHKDHTKVSAMALLFELLNRADIES